ncbi:hypothetical protein E3O44_15980 [Cryobacterium algoricola]|uniref:Uncharacterized protein n=1 Tax=Cryobacterium algoricola TaxID=1259183 RepID=A0ABY2ICG7_9MICO|nr:hypothetical protein [Cryobacterium algoricola]TFB84326.1 hypothetical protein E3O44_15980 [Cryobacterium algoricola]
MAHPPSPGSRLLTYATVTVQSDAPAPFTITGVDIWTTHAVVYGQVLDPTADIHWSTPDEVRFDGLPFEVGPLTVEPGPVCGEAGYPGSIAVSTRDAPSPDARTVTLSYGRFEVTGTIGAGARP